MIFTNCGLLGDMFLCLPVLSWYYKKYNEKVIFALADHFPYSKNAQELLEMQECISEVIYFNYDASKCDNRTPDNLGKYHITKEMLGYDFRHYVNHDIISLGFHKWPDKYVPELYAEEYDLGVDYDFKMNYGEPDFHYSNHIVKVDKFENPQLSEIDGLSLAVDWPMLKNLQLAAGAKGLITFTTGFSIMASLSRIPMILYSYRHLIDHHKNYFVISDKIDWRYLG